MIRLALRCPTERAEQVLAELLELAPGGVEEERGDDWVEFAIYGPPGELPELPEVVARAAGGEVEITSTEIPDDWADRWRDFHEPIVIGDRLCVRPSWEQESAPDRAIEVVIDPGNAFGTGAHATTRICLELLLELADRGRANGPLVDLGTGSGVLGIAAAKLGWNPVAGCDSEEAALAAAAENAAANRVGLDLARVNLRVEAPPAAPTVVANLTAPLLQAVAGKLTASQPPPRILACSGLLTAEVDRVQRAFAPCGLRLEEVRFSGDWAGILFAGETTRPETRIQRR